MRANTFASVSGFAKPPATGGGGSGALELLESHDFGADATSHTFSGLDGDTDEIYVIEYKLIKATSSSTHVSVEPNGLTTDQECRGQYFGTSGSGVLNGSTMQLFSNGSAGVGDVEAGCATFFAKSGVFRTMRADWTQSPVAGGVFGISMASVWGDDSTNITSLGLVADVSSGIKAGSYVSLYRVNR